MSSRRLRIVIDGNIGSGKSTQLKMLSVKYKVQCEPIDDWPLDLFYENPSRWVFLLQMSILKSFNERTADIWERSPESSKEVFWNILSKTESENDVYTYFYEKCGWSPDVHVYIRTDPSRCLERILTRFQEGDVKITREYLEKVHESYERYIASKSQVKIIDGNKNPEEIHSEIIRYVSEMLGYDEKRNEM